MSHVAKIAKLKAELIKLGITDPTQQTAIARTAYVRALGSYRYRNPGCEAHLGGFLDYILGYWNETYPVAGNLVKAELARFNFALMAALHNLGKVSRIDLKIVDTPDVPDDLKLDELAVYSELVDQLNLEATQKHAEYLKYYVES